jgi:hypothetical protein
VSLAPPSAAPRRRAGLSGTGAPGRGALAATGPQDEGGARTGQGGQHVGVVEHDEPAVEQCPALDAQAGPAPAPRARRQWQPAQPEARGVVLGDAAGIATAGEQGQLPRQGPPRGPRPRRRPGDAPVVVGAEGGQEGVGGLRRGDALQAQFADEAILQGLPQALDAPLGLGEPAGMKPIPRFSSIRPKWVGSPAPRTGEPLDTPEDLPKEALRQVAFGQWLSASWRMKYRACRYLHRSKGGLDRPVGVR